MQANVWKDNNTNRNKRVLLKLSNDFHSGTSATILSAYLKADGSGIDKMQPSQDSYSSPSGFRNVCGGKRLLWGPALCKFLVFAD
jgi:hypothetical protein